VFRRSISLSDQVKRQIREWIDEDGYAQSDGQLPSETQLSERLGVSRATVREALTMLARDGVVVRRHGVGTFVNNNLPGLRATFTENVEFEDMIAQQGYDAGVEVLRIGTEPVGTLAEPLGIDADDEVYVVEKVFLADSVPVIFCHNAIPMKLLGSELLTNANNNALGREPIYRLLQSHGDQNVSYQVSHLTAAVADQTMAEQLLCAPGYPLLCIEEFGYNDLQEPILYCLNYHRSDIIRFDAVRRVIRPYSWEQPVN
jgi:GntR family transcriptional regulator